MIIVIVDKAQFDHFFEIFSKLIQFNCIKFGSNLPTKITTDCTDCTVCFADNKLLYTPAYFGYNTIDAKVSYLH